MRFDATTVLFLCVSAVWFVLVAGVIALVALTRIAPVIGHDVIVIRGASMSPALPVGSLVMVDRGGRDRIAQGDIVTMRLRNGVLVTHRVLRVTTLPTGTYVETKGDANAKPDAVLIPVESVVGVVEVAVPYAGFALAYLSLPTGIVSTISLLTALLLGAWVLQDAQPATPRAPLAPARSIRRADT